MTRAKPAMISMMRPSRPSDLQPGRHGFRSSSRSYFSLRVMMKVNRENAARMIPSQKGEKTGAYPEFGNIVRIFAIQV